MATIQEFNDEKVYVIDKFLGVNECVDGDADLKMGEAVSMQNAKITKEYNLQKRPGTSNVAGLMGGYTQSVSLEAVTLFTEYNTTDDAYNMYPEMSVSDTGIASVSGTPVSVNYTNHASYTDYYYTDGVKVYKFDDIVFSEASEGGTAVTGGSVSISTTLTTIAGVQSVIAYPGIAVSNGAVVVTGTPVGVSAGNHYAYVGYYFVYNGTIYRLYSSTVQGTTEYVTGLDGSSIAVGFTLTYSDFRGYAVTYRDSDAYRWNFFEVSASAAPLDEAVRAVWSGYIGGTEHLVAACDGCLWALTETEGVWSKKIIGTINTNNSVCLFGFDEKLYIMDGVDYKEWDASTFDALTYTAAGTETGDYYFTHDSTDYIFTMPEVSAGDVIVYNIDDDELTINGDAISFSTGTATDETELTMTETDWFYPISDVIGYRPLITVATGISGSGTEREQINKLNGLRRFQISPPGGSATFTLPEAGTATIASVDYVNDLATGTNLTLTTDYTVAGTKESVTFNSAPSAGTNTYEIGYTVSETYRADVEAMRFATLYNGANENRVFIYGDGTNRAFYSGLDEDGNARADYFPDLNILDAGDTSTPITSMIKHYDRLLIFKTDSAYSVSYDTITLPSGTATPGFYMRTVNAEVGSVGYNQAVLVENHPRTLFDGCVYEWQATTTSGNVTGDQRNAKRVSDRAQITLGEMDLESAFAYYDYFTHEYYVIEDGVAVIHNTENNTWYVYRSFPATCMTRYHGELYIGCSDGYIKHVSDDYLGDQGENIQCFWISGSMSFKEPYKYKYSDSVFPTLKADDDAEVYVTVQTDKDDDFPDAAALASKTGSSVTGFLDWLKINFATLSFNPNEKPKTTRLKLKAKKFIWYKLIFSSVTNDTTFTVLNVSIRVRSTGMVK